MKHKLVASRHCILQQSISVFIFPTNLVINLNPKLKGRSVYTMTKTAKWLSLPTKIKI